MDYSDGVVPVALFRSIRKEHQANRLDSVSPLHLYPCYCFSISVTDVVADSGVRLQRKPECSNPYNTGS